MDEDFIAELRAENTQGYAERGLAHSCVFTDVEDARIPEGFDCGGCSCHLAAPCNHCLSHIDEDESHSIALMTHVLGRWTR